FFENPALTRAMDHVAANHSTLHLQGLLSDGGVHSHISHLFALLEMAKQRGIEDVYVHCFLDGRDVPPDCAAIYLRQLQDEMDRLGVGRIADIAGRYYAMDRDKRWERLRLAYEAMTEGSGETAPDARAALSASYGRKEYDEFVRPTVIDRRGLVRDGDSVIMFNFRPDRAREITRAFVDRDFQGFPRRTVVRDLVYVCMTQYDAEMPNVSVAFPPEHYRNTLGEYIASLGMRQLRIAETEKYAHVTFFFNGGVEEPNRNEERILIPSPKVATYDLQPEMSAPEITREVLRQIGCGQFDVIILNFANADMVGHTGSLEAAIKAIEALDACVPQVVDAVLESGGQVLLTADHGNADEMLDEHGARVTAHSLNPVPLVNISADPLPLKDGGRLCDLAPTMLDMMGLEIPPEMTGHSLLQR
ncbi:MAG: 2,3-bisphosphoglycerate-independent phosphoglycerate mutase, partial [Anaerovoracaceae bacterium]